MKKGELSYILRKSVIVKDLFRVLCAFSFLSCSLGWTFAPGKPPTHIFFHLASVWMTYTWTTPFEGDAKTALTRRCIHKHYSVWVYRRTPLHMSAPNLRFHFQETSALKRRQMPPYLTVTPKWENIPPLHHMMIFLQSYQVDWSWIYILR